MIRRGDIAILVGFYDLRIETDLLLAGRRGLAEGYSSPTPVLLGQSPADNAFWAYSMDPGAFSSPVKSRSLLILSHTCDCNSFIFYGWNKIINYKYFVP